jgi:hypothetical protein
MTVEASFSYPSDLNASYPAAGDNKSEGDDHLRGIKTCFKTTFPNVSGAITPTHTVLNYMLGVTSGVQAQLDLKAALAGPTFTGTVVLPSTTSIGTVSATEIGYLDNLTGAIQTQIDAEIAARAAADTSLDTLKANLASPTFTGTPAAPTAAVGTGTTQIATTAFVAATALVSALPGQVGNSGKFVTTDGANASWAVPTGLQVSNTPAGNIVATTVQAAIDELDTDKQAVLVSGTTIKTIDGTSLLGAGDITRSPGDHAIKVTTGNAFGSTNTKVRRYTTTAISTGSQVVYADSAANGASFTIQSGGDGLYEITVKDFQSASSFQIGASLNSAELTTDIESITAANRLISASLPTGTTTTQTITVRLVAGDVVRPHMGGTLPDGNTATRSVFTIRKVGL